MTDDSMEQSKDPSPQDQSSDSEPAAPPCPASELGDEKSAPPTAESVRDYLLYTVSLPERALRSSVGVVGGAIRESAGLLVPQALRDSNSYTVLVQQTLDFLVEDVGGVERSADDPSGDPRVENFVARKTVGNFVEMAGMATLHLSPMMVLAIASDVAHGSKALLGELAVELRREGIIDEDSTIDNTADLMAAISNTASTASRAFDTPPLSLEGLQETVAKTAAAAEQIDAADALPQAEIERLWSEMKQLAEAEHVSLLQMSSAMTLHSLGKMADVGRGALSSVRVAGSLIDRHVLDYYSDALSEIHRDGYYRTLAKVSGPYVEAVWRNFSTEQPTITEDLLSGRMISRAGKNVARWLGAGEPAEPPEPPTEP